MADGSDAASDVDFEKLIEEARMGSRNALGDILQACNTYLRRIARRQLPVVDLVAQAVAAGRPPLYRRRLATLDRTPGG
jgi:hypothetical protein